MDDLIGNEVHSYLPKSKYVSILSNESRKGGAGGVLIPPCVEYGSPSMLQLFFPWTSCQGCLPTPPSAFQFAVERMAMMGESVSTPYSVQ